MRCLGIPLVVLLVAGPLFAADPLTPRERYETCARLFAMLSARKPKLPPEVQQQVDLLMAMNRVLVCERLLDVWEAAERANKPFPDLMELRKLVDEAVTDRDAATRRVQSMRAAAVRDIRRAYLPPRPATGAGASDDDDKKKAAAYLAQIEKELNSRYPGEVLSAREKEWAEELRAMGIPANKALPYLTFIKLVERQVQLEQPMRRLSPLEARMAVRMRDHYVSAGETAHFIREACINEEAR